MESIYTKKQEILIELWIYLVCLVCAFTNILGYLAYTLSISHHSGNLVYVIDFTSERFSPRHIFILILLIISFTAGAIVAAFVNRNRDFRMEHRYGEVQVIIGALVLLLYWLPTPLEGFVAFLAFSLGIENGLIRSIRGFGFKTTHMTGTFSDLGSMIGYKMQRIPDTGWKIRLELCLVLAFIAGSVLGLLAFDPLLDNAFVVGGCGYIAIGLLYIWLRRRFLKSTTISH